MKKRMLAVMLTVAMLLSMLPMQSFATEESQTPPQAEKPEILTLLNLDYDAAVEDVSYLSKVIGTRPTGSANERLGQDYVAAELTKLGYAVERQAFDLGTRDVGDIFLGELTLAAAIPINAVFGEAEGIAVYLDDPAKVASLGEDLSGKIVFFPGNWRYGVQSETYSAIAALNNANAEAVVVMMDLSVSPNEVSKTALPSMNCNSCGQTIDIPVLLTASMEAERVPAYLAEHGEVEVRVKSSDTTTSQNVIGVKKAAVDTDLTIYVTAHIDTVKPSPGANDNGAGVAGLLALARALQDVETNYNICFVVFGAEEIYQVGSMYFTENLTEEEISNAIGNYNMDMIASQHCGCLCLDTYTKYEAPDDDPSTDTHVTRMSWEAALDLGFTAENCYVDYGGFSDHISFHDVGIPAVAFTRETDRDSHDLEPYYHTAKDNMDVNFSKETMEETLDVVALAVYRDATADYAAVVGEGVYREYYATMEEAEAAAAASGATLRDLRTASDENMKFKSASLSLDSSIGMNIYVNEAVLDGYEDPYVLIEKLYGDQVIYETCKVYPTETVQQGTVTCINFLYEDLAAKEMSATVRMTLYAKKDGVLTRGEVRDYSILTYAMITLGRTTDPVLRTLLVDMLNYGAKAQDYFNFHEEFLANSTLTEEQKAWATAEEPTMVNGTIKDNPSIPGSGSYPFAITSATLLLEDKVELIFFMNPGTEDFTGKKMILTYVNGIGKEIRTELSAENFVRNANGLYEVTFDGLSAKDMRVLVTCWIADEEGERMSNAVTYGIECYAAFKVSNEALKPLLLDMMRYGDSARNYFAAINQA